MHIGLEKKKAKILIQATQTDL